MIRELKKAMKKIPRFCLCDFASLREKIESYSGIAEEKRINSDLYN